MKQLTSYNRAAGYLNKIFDLLNEAFLNLHFQDLLSPFNPPRKPMATSPFGKIHGFPSWAAPTKSTLVLVL